MTITKLVRACYENSVQHGFHDLTLNVGEKIALIHSELSEALEDHRRGIKPDEHLPNFKNFDVELADACIRIFDLAGATGVDLESAIMAKMAYNERRPYKHGKNY